MSRNSCTVDWRRSAATGGTPPSLSSSESLSASEYGKYNAGANTATQAVNENNKAFGIGMPSTERPAIPERANIWDMDRRRRNVYSQEEKTEAWSKAAEMVQAHSDEMITLWKEEIDTYLVFAGLFSAALTTFNVQSYVLLQPAAPDPSLALLKRISAQLESFSVHPPFINSTQPPNAESIYTSAPTTPVPRWVVWLNGLWFSGLILSLSAASLGIMVKQWSNEYTSGVSGTSRPVARLRQHRLNHLKKWHVQDVVGTIPVLLQLALACFLAGLLILLWNLHTTVAVVSSILAGFLCVFTIVTTLLPLFYSSCSYLTPQVRALQTVWQPKYLAYWLHSSATSWSYNTAGFLISMPYRLTSFALRLGCILSRLAAQLQKRLIILASYIASPPVSWKERKQTRQGRERSIVSSLTADLDKQILLEAYNLTLHPDALSVASVCLMDFEASFTLDFFSQLHRSAREHFGTAADSEDGPLGRGNQEQLLWLQILLCILTEGDVARRLLSDAETAALCLYFRHGMWPSSMKASDAEWAMSAIHAVVDHLERTVSRELDFLGGVIFLKYEGGKLYQMALERKEHLFSVSMLEVTRAYRQVRLSEPPLPDGAVDDAKAAISKHLMCISHFLERADEAFRVPLPSDSLPTVRAYARDVLTEMTPALLRVFAEDRAAHLRTTVDAEALWYIVWRLAQDVSDDVLRCVPDGDQLGGFVRMVETLARSHEYDNSFWEDGIRRFATELKQRILCIKGQPAGPTASRE